MYRQKVICAQVKKLSHKLATCTRVHVHVHVATCMSFMQELLFILGWKFVRRKVEGSGCKSNYLSCWKFNFGEVHYGLAKHSYLKGASLKVHVLEIAYTLLIALVMGSHFVLRCVPAGSCCGGERTADRSPPLACESGWGCVRRSCITRNITKNSLHTANTDDNHYIIHVISCTTATGQCSMQSCLTPLVLGSITCSPRRQWAHNIIIEVEFQIRPIFRLQTILDWQPGTILLAFLFLYYWYAVAGHQN